MNQVLEDNGKSLLSVKNLKIYFSVQKSFLDRMFALGKLKFCHAVDDVSIELKKGETLGIVGESGSGKSTLGYGIIGLVDVTEGSIFFEGIKINAKLSEKQEKYVKSNIQMVFQDPFSSLNPSMKIGEVITRPLMVSGKKFTRSQVREKLSKALNEVGLKEDDAGKYPHEFSGGQKQRIAIARVLIVDPDLIIADEITSSLDVSIQSQILNILMKLKSKNLSMIYITHDLRVARLINDRIAIMYMGKIIEQGKTSEIYSNPLHPYTRALLSAIPGNKMENKIYLKGRIPSLINPKPGCRLYSRCPYRKKICKTEYPLMVSDTSGEHSVACHLIKSI
jgi:oligopeptide/dipeptide ABC transporter ATP-binding protein